MCEEIDLSDNYIEGKGANALADMLKDNMFIVNLVSTSHPQGQPHYYVFIYV